MPPSSQVKARVVDISSHHPREHDSVIVDTNVLYWTHYDYAALVRLGGRAPKTYQAEEYSNWFDEALEANSKLSTSPANLTELAHILERAHLEVAWRKAIPTTTPGSGAPTVDFNGVNLKAIRQQFAGNLPEIRRDIGVVLASVRKNLELTSAPDKELVNRFISEWQSCSCDASDAVMVATAKLAGIPNILTDDKDMIYIDGITVYTANPVALKEARAMSRVNR